MPAPRDNLKPEESENRNPASEITEDADYLPAWTETAWRAYQRGQRNWSALGRQFGVTDKTVKKWVKRFSEIAALARSEETVDAHLSYVTGLEETLGAAWQLHATAQGMVKVACLNRVESILEKLAAAEGVVTKREGKEVSGPGGKALEGMSEAESIMRAIQLGADLVAHSAGRTGDADSLPSPDLPVESAQSD